ncbi:Major facilitator superfamily, partial [Globisporangium splendens]
METTALYAGHEDTAAPPVQQGSRSYAIIVCVFASLDGAFFGYDQGVTGGVLVMDSFLNAFCVGYGKDTRAMCHAQAHELPTNWLTFTTLYNVVYYVGCILGAFAGGYVADKFGRRVTCFSAGLLFCTGTLWVVLVPAQAHTAILCGRVLQGMGVGNSSLSLPIFGAEMAPKELWGFLSGFMQMMVVTGLLLANIVNVVVEHIDNGWRYTNAVAMLPPIVVMLGIFCVPESPRWVYQKNGRDVARATLQRIRQNEDVQTELDAIGDQIAVEGDHSIGWNEIFSVPTIRQRMIVAMALQLLQQATRVNAVFTYGG